MKREAGMKLGWILLALALSACTPEPPSDLHIGCTETTPGDFDCVAIEV